MVDLGLMIGSTVRILMNGGSSNESPSLDLRRTIKITYLILIKVTKVTNGEGLEEAQFMVDLGDFPSDECVALPGAARKDQPVQGAQRCDGGDVTCR